MDRPKDKTPPAGPTLPALPARSVSAGDVVAYLRQHPDFLNEHDDLLEVLTPPNMQRGERVVDMQRFMVQHQRAEIARLKSQYRTLVSTSRANLATQARVHTAVLALLAANSFEQLIQIVTTDLAVLLDADVVTIAVESSGSHRPHLTHQGVQILDPGTVNNVLGPDRDVVLLSDVAGDPVLFGDGAGLVKSAALLRLCVSSAAPAGLLCIGMRRSGKFHGGQGTELLGFLARSLGITIAAWLDLPT
ncbi:MAG TPA: DUF484 family protein [Stellaceae bacterium]|nr:DUF484 family protein [Stellaceae bacterium]